MRNKRFYYKYVFIISSKSRNRSQCSEYARDEKDKKCNATKINKKQHKTNSLDSFRKYYQNLIRVNSFFGLQQLTVRG